MEINAPCTANLTKHDVIFDLAFDTQLSLTLQNAFVRRAMYYKNKFEMPKNALEFGKD